MGGGRVTGKIVSAGEALSPLGPYRAGLAALSHGDPARSPAVLHAWYDCFGDLGRDPVVIVGGDDGPALGMLALTWRKPMPGRYGRVLGSTTNNHSGYTALLVHPAAPPNLLDALLDPVARLEGWDCLDLDGLAEPLAEGAVAWAARHGLRIGPQRENRNLVHQFGPDREQALPKRAKNTRTRERGLERVGTLALDSYTEPEAVRAAFEEYLAAERGSWKAQTGEIMASRPDVLAFYRRLVEEPDEHTQVHIELLRLDGRAIAGNYSIANGTTLLGIKTFYVEELASYSPGTILDHRSLEALARGRGIDRLDFYTDIRHYEHFANLAETYQSLLLWRRTPRATAARLAQRLRNVAVRRLHGLRAWLGPGFRRPQA